MIFLDAIWLLEVSVDCKTGSKRMDQERMDCGLSGTPSFQLRLEILHKHNPRCFIGQKKALEQHLKHSEV